MFAGARRRLGGFEESAHFEDAVARIAEREPTGPAEAIAVLAGGPPAIPAHLELGAANAWRSVGPLRLWTAGTGRVAGSVASLLSERPELARCSVPVALAVAFDEPRSCWIGVEVSERTDDGYVVGLPAVEALLGRLFDHGPAV